MPTVSIILPTYNRAAFLREAVDSVVAQTFSDWELIVVDDGSTDDTRTYLRSLKDTRVRILERDHAGLPGKVRNAGIAIATGEYVAFLDSDDLWDRDKLEAQLAVIRADTDVRWGYTYTCWIDGAGGLRAMPGVEKRRPCAGWIFEQLLTHTAWVALPTVMVQRDLLREVGGFNEQLRFSEDFDLWLRLSRRSRVCVVDRPIVSVRMHPYNSWRQQRSTSMESWFGVYDRLLGDPTLGAARRTCRRMRAKAAAHLADAYRDERRYGRGIRALLRALPSGLTVPAWWAALAKTSLRPITPEPALRVYRALRA